MSREKTGFFSFFNRFRSRVRSGKRVFHAAAGFKEHLSEHLGRLPLHEIGNLLIAGLQILCRLPVKAGEQSAGLVRHTLLIPLDGGAAPGVLGVGEGADQAVCPVGPVFAKYSGVDFTWA